MASRPSDATLPGASGETSTRRSRSRLQITPFRHDYALSCMEWNREIYLKRFSKSSVNIAAVTAAGANNNEPSAQQIITYIKRKSRDRQHVNYVLALLA